MTRVEKYARVYAAWLLIWSNVQQDFYGEQWEDGVGLALDLLLNGTGLESYDLYKEWPVNVVTYRL